MYLSNRLSPHRQQMSRRLVAALKLSLALLVAPLAQAQTTGDVPKSADHPLVSRFPGSVITDYTQTSFDDCVVPLGLPGPDGVPAQSRKVEGKVTRIVYATPAPRSVLEVYKNFEAALGQGGFKILFSCANDGCGSGSSGPVQLASAGKEDWNWHSGQRFLAAERSGPTADVYVTLHVGQWAALDHGTQTVLFVAETKPIETGLVKVNAAAIGNELASQGHASIYGIYFDTAKADVKPASEPQLQQIAQLLKDRADLKLLVVGHTDDVGPLAANTQLSRHRADAVVQALVSRYGVASARLSAQGAGPLAPVATNRTDDGRAKNRRVELVEQ